MLADYKSCLSGGVQEGPAQGGHVARQHRQGEVCEPVPGRAPHDVPPVPAEVLALHPAGGVQLSAGRPRHPAAPPAAAAGRDDALLLPPDDADPPVPAGHVGGGRRGRGVLPPPPRHVDVAG